MFGSLAFMGEKPPADAGVRNLHPRIKGTYLLILMMEYQLNVEISELKFGD